MPELPEVETVIRQIESKISGKTIVGVQKSGLNLRKDIGCGQGSLRGQKIQSLSRWGKRILIHLDRKNNHLDVSLGMTGMLRVEPKGARGLKHDHLSLRLNSGDRLIYNDPRRFGWVTFSRDEFKHKGWDPLLSSKKDFKEIVLKASASKKTIYSFLMDQQYIVGLGNIYVQEILYKAGVSPFRISQDCTPCTPLELEAVRKNTKIILNRSLNFGGSTILSYVNAEGGKGAFQNELNVYGKKKSEPCLVCKTPISHVMEARSISYCSCCQR